MSSFPRGRLSKDFRSDWGPTLGLDYLTPFSSHKLVYVVCRDWKRWEGLNYALLQLNNGLLIIELSMILTSSVKTARLSI